MESTELLAVLKQKSIVFADVLTLIDSLYQHHPTAFRNGETFNTAEQNQGSARVLAYALLNQLPAPETLLLFAEHYEAVLADPGGTNHQNIRQFMDQAGVSFDGTVLSAK